MFTRYRILTFATVYLVLANAGKVYSDVIFPTLPVGTQYRLAFVTNDARTVASHIGYDQNVTNQFIADQASQNSILRDLNTEWFAIASIVTNSNPVTYTSISVLDVSMTRGTGVPIYRLDGVKVADNYIDLWDGTLDASISINQFGAQKYTNVFTNFSEFGLHGGSNELITTGDSSQANSRWASFIAGLGNATLPFYGISGTITAVPEPSSFVIFTIAAAGMLLIRTRYKISAY